jgi:hypothetical protein
MAMKVGRGCAAMHAAMVSIAVEALIDMAAASD